MSGLGSLTGLALACLHVPALGLSPVVYKGSSPLALPPATPRRCQSSLLQSVGIPTDIEAELAPFELPDQNNLGLQAAAVAVDALFKFGPFWERAKHSARSKIVSRAATLGVDWPGQVDAMKRVMDKLEAQYDSLLDPKVQAATPAYYKVPFHAYEDGNLCWQAGLEVDPSAVAVHANIYTDAKNVFEKDGDEKLRNYYQARMRDMLKSQPRDILDVGCSTGLSTIKLAEAFPEARITGVDLSPYMLAVGSYNLGAKESQVWARNRVTYMHAAGECTGLADSSFDLVSVCLVSHELPVSAAREMFREAHRLLRPGGVLSFMDMNPFSPAFQQMAANPFAFAGFKSTEPYLTAYISMDLAKELCDAGFQQPQARNNSPRHRTVVAYVEK